jgi:hypothetical protein
MFRKQDDEICEHMKKIIRSKVSPHCIIVHVNLFFLQKGNK